MSALSKGPMNMTLNNQEMVQKVPTNLNDSPHQIYKTLGPVPAAPVDPMISVPFFAPFFKDCVPRRSGLHQVGRLQSRAAALTDLGGLSTELFLKL